MALQEGLLKPGASVRLHAIVEPQFRALNDCNATLIGCLRERLLPLRRRAGRLRARGTAAANLRARAPREFTAGD